MQPFPVTVYVVVQFCPWFKFYFLLFWGMVIYDNEFETKKNKIWTKDKIEPQHIHNPTKSFWGAFSDNMAQPILYSRNCAQ